MIEDVILGLLIGGFVLGLLGVWRHRASLWRLGGGSIFLAGAAMMAQPALAGIDHGLPPWITPLGAVAPLLCGLFWMFSDPKRQPSPSEEVHHG